MAACAKCGADAGAERWKTLCGKCFRKQKLAEEEAREDALERAMGENAALTAALRQLLQERKREQAQVVNAIPPEKLRQLIQLCHPDKHNGSRAATEITQWLNKLREGR